MKCVTWFSWIARAGTLMVKTRFSVSLVWGGRVIWIGINLLGSSVVCRAGGPFWAVVGADDDCDDVVGCWPGSVLIAGCWRFFGVGKLLFGKADASGGTDNPFALPFIDDAAVIFCSAAKAFFDFVPFAWNSEKKIWKRFLRSNQLRASNSNEILCQS